SVFSRLYDRATHQKGRPAAASAFCPLLLHHPAHAFLHLSSTLSLPSLSSLFISPSLLSFHRFSFLFLFPSFSLHLLLSSPLLLFSPLLSSPPPLIPSS